MYYNINGYDINLILLDDASGVPGSVWSNEDGSFTIFIDSSLCLEKQQKVFKHELNHILSNDFEKTDVNEIEFVTHNLFSHAML